MPKIKYHHALDSDGNVISISAVTEADRNKEFRCLGCGELMRPRLGCKNAHHFAHKNDEFNCSPETYIHKLAKQKIKEWFDSDKPFQISYYQEVTCADANSCPFHKDNECHDLRLKTYDLKEYYDTCSIEEQIGGFIADLLLTSKKNPSIPPVLIEIQVTHKSEAEKLESKHKIIEIKITSEEDINSLLQSPAIKETSDSQYDRTPKGQQSISFYEFKKDTAPEHLEMRGIPKFYLFRSGKSYVTNMDAYPSCREATKSDNPHAILELAIDRFYLDSITPYAIGYAMADQLGLNVKNCQFCKFWRSGYTFDFSANFCCLYKKCGTPRNPDGPEAMTCKHYSVDSQREQEILDAANSTPIVVVKQ